MVRACKLACSCTLEKSTSIPCHNMQPPVAPVQGAPSMLFPACAYTWSSSNTSCMPAHVASTCSGKCCTGSGEVWVKEDEAQRLADHFSISLTAFYDTYCKAYDKYKASQTGTMFALSFVCLLSHVGCQFRASCCVCDHTFPLPWYAWPCQVHVGVVSSQLCMCSCVGVAHAQDAARERGGSLAVFVIMVAGHGSAGRVH
jgi:hypothetical protein